MAKQKAKSTDVAVVEEKPVQVMGDRPSYLPTPVESGGMENMGKDDFKTPRIVLLQGLSPQLENYPQTAKKDTFWHTGMNISLGKEFMMVPVIANKRVILWRPRGDQGGGILAFSRNGRTWDTGANQEFQIKIKGRKDPVVWRTGKDVLSSRLTAFGTSNPDEIQSAPAATTVYEYLCILPDHMDLSPCVLGISKTALPNGKNFNTSLAMKHRQGIPICSLKVRCFVEETSNSEGVWTIPNFELSGYVDENIYKLGQRLAKEYADYNVEYTQEETSTEASIGDNINY